MKRLSEAECWQRTDDAMRNPFGDIMWMSPRIYGEMIREQIERREEVHDA